MKRMLYTCLLALALPCMAQDNIIDEVIWIVGDDAILRSEVEEERLRAQYEGQAIPGDPYCVIPEQMAIQKLFLHQAELDSVEVSESTVSHQVDMRLNYYISQIGSKEKMEEVLANHENTSWWIECQFLPTFILCDFDSALYPDDIVLFVHEDAFLMGTADYIP